MGSWFHDRKVNKRLEDIQHQKELFNESSKGELWERTHQLNNALVVSCYIAGCALAASLFPPSFLSLASILISFLILLFSGSVFGLMIYAVIYSVSSITGGTPIFMLNLWQKLLLFLLFPAVVLLLTLVL